MADQFYLLGHDDRTGRARLASRVCGLGLGAALLAELVYSRHLWVQGGRLRLLRRPVPVDALAHTVLDQLAAQPERTDVRTWVRFFAGNTTDLVAERLWRTGYLRPRTMRRRLISTSVVYVPTDTNRAAMPWALLSMKLRCRASLAQDEVFLAGLCAATGLDRFLLDGLPAGSRSYFEQAVGAVWQPAYELVAAARTAVGDAVLAARS
ncbi:GPP34 family phosphoprotein [Solwaraspora sp. WMMD1047]|uniref:GOLPH3/VPS74 family protein n=1 Tax=Solwaraspora sp. WMMD1047 TaxID=3016102 RepID=UPI0024176420|nr:GPP34 family phosphoprotein [Solwaraspora sp. WMMD1047]MDG4832996.1 GPP34 family phosphoprotein [Solwaraspora sp. WMMD1047]